MSVQELITVVSTGHLRIVSPTYACRMIITASQLILKVLPAAMAQPANWTQTM